MEFDRFTVALLILRSDAPEFDERAAAELQDAHMAHLADLHDAGHLLMAGPVDDEHIRGVSVLNVDVEEAEGLLAEDPAVKAGRLTNEVFQWMVPGGTVSFSPTHFPRSIAEVSGE